MTSQTDKIEAVLHNSKHFTLDSGKGNCTSSWLGSIPFRGANGEIYRVPYRLFLGGNGSVRHGGNEPTMANDKIYPSYTRRAKGKSVPLREHIRQRILDAYQPEMLRALRTYRREMKESQAQAAFNFAGLNRRVRGF